MPVDYEQHLLCNDCTYIIKEKNYMECSVCDHAYHFFPCSPYREHEYNKILKDGKEKCICKQCKNRAKSPNNLYQFVYHVDVQEPQSSKTENKSTSQKDTDGISLKNKQRNDDDEGNLQKKKYKEAIGLNAVNTKLCSVQSEVTELNNNVRVVQNTIEQMSTNLISMKNEIKEDMQSTLQTITESIATLVTQVSNLTVKCKELDERDKQRETQIQSLDTRLNRTEQQLLNRNIEIKNVPNDEIGALDVVKTIASSINVVVNDTDVVKAFRLNRKEGKVIVEFSSLSKKREFMGNISKHRIDAKIIKSDAKTFMYVNDELTPYNRRLLWMAKTKAKEANWKFIWYNNGYIFARKNEHSSAIYIKNPADIDTFLQ